MKQKVPVKVRVWVSELSRPPQRQAHSSWSTKLLTALILASAVGLVAGGGWLAVRLIVNPADLSWLSHVLPLWNDAAVARPQTLSEIAAEVKQAGRSVGQAVHLSTYPGMTQQQIGFYDILLPILNQPKHCSDQSHCAYIEELRVYRPASQAASKQGTTYDLIDRIAVVGPEELTAIAPLTQTSTITQGSSRTLPLTNISWIEGKAPKGIWFQLSGEWKRGSRVLYGEVLQYAPQRERLSALQSWSSPSGKMPRWQQIVSDATPELLVDQSIGLEPQFQVYQVKWGASLAQAITLEPISFTEASLSDRAYSNSLLLARHGLWSSALQLMKTVKQKGKWSAAAQAQLDVIALHAQVTQTQAKRDWASPSQQILAQIMDGQWAKALSLLKSAHTSGYDVQNLIATNSDRLWQRIETALRVNARQPELQQWGVLVLAVRQNRAKAIAWWQRQTAKVKTNVTATQTLALLDPAVAPTQPKHAPTIPVAVPAASVDSTHATSCLLGTATAIANPGTQDWSAPSSVRFSLQPQQQWYEINVLGFFDGKQWQQSPARLANATAQSNQNLWNQLGLTNTQLQLVAWQGTTPVHTISASVQAFRLQNGQLSLLAKGDAMPANLDTATIVAITPASISWSEPSATLTLNELAQQQTIWQTKLIPQLWQDLQTAQLISTAAPANDPLQTIGNWSVQQMELTGDQPLETILTIEAAEASTELQKTHTVIFSSQGSILYSDLSRQQSLTAIVNRTISNLPILIISSPEGTYLQQWSSQEQQFK